MRRLGKALANLPGWSTKRKIVVIESDDWGGLRAPSKDGFERLYASGLDVSGGDALRYNRFDTLATSSDLEFLFEALSKYEDSTGRHPVVTALSVVANPDFEKIAEFGYENYFYEPFTQTLHKQPGCEGAFRLWQEGIRKRLFVPQFHGREHLNVASWMRALQNRDKQTLEAFDQKFWGFNNNYHTSVLYQAAFDLEVLEDIELQAEIISDGLSLFNRIFGYSATFFVPPNGPFNSSLEKVTADNGIKYISTPKIHLEPLGGRRYRRRFRYPGMKNKFGQSYLCRNCSFEPSIAGLDWIKHCLNEVETAFCFMKPAVISTHRVNYVGSLSIENRINGVLKLQELLGNIIACWPEVEFLTSSELGDLMSRRYNE